MDHLDKASPPAPDFLDLSTELQKKLKAFIHKRVLNPEDAEDIFQLTCLEAWRSKARFNGQATLSTWMCGIAQNLIRNHFRRFTQGRCIASSTRRSAMNRTTASTCTVNLRLTAGLSSR